MFKVIHDLAPPPLTGCIVLSGSGSASRTRASTRGDLVTHFRKTTIGQSVFSVKVVKKWNSIPTNIRNSGSLAVFKASLKIWLKLAQECRH